MFKKLTDETYFLARQAVQLRKARMYSLLKRATAWPVIWAGRKPVESASLSYASKTENDQNKLKKNLVKSWWCSKKSFSEEIVEKPSRYFFTDLCSEIYCEKIVE